MVDVTMLQSLSYVAAAIGVCVAAIYYAMNLREANRNRRITLTTNLMQSFISEVGCRRFIDIMNMRWKDFDDFYKKYDSTVNPDNFAKRNSFFNSCEVLGYQYRHGLIDIGTLNAACTEMITISWAKFKPIFDSYKRFGDYSKHLYENFEYLANEMNKISLQRDPTHKGSRGYITPEKYEEAYKK